MNREERQQSLRRLHMYITTYQPTPQDMGLLQKAHRELLAQIQRKFAQSSHNHHYIFPRTLQMNQGSQGPVDKFSLQRISQGKLNDTLSRPKIKLVRPRQEKRVQTEYCNDQNLVHHLKNELGYFNKSAKVNNIDNNIASPLKDILNKATSKRYLPLARDASGCGKGKSKLNQLTRSYANLKSKLGINWHSNNNEGYTYQLSDKESINSKILPKNKQAQTKYTQPRIKNSTNSFLQEKTCFKLQ